MRPRQSRALGLSPTVKRNLWPRQQDNRGVERRVESKEGTVSRERSSIASVTLEEKASLISPCS